jgi:catecholate siderophore receptor
MVGFSVSSGSPVRRRALLAAASSASLLACAGGVWAAEDAGAALTEDDNPVAEVVVTGEREGYGVGRTRAGTRTDTAIRDTPQAVTVITDELIRDQSMRSMADVVRYVPGVAMAQGEGHRDAPVIRGVTSTADFFVDGVRDDVQYFRDLYNVERVEVLKGPNAMIFGRGGGGGVINRVTERAGWIPTREVTIELSSFDHRRATFDLNQPLSPNFTVRLNGMYEDSGSFRDFVEVQRSGFNPTATWLPNDQLTVQLGYEHFEDDRTVDRGVPSFQGRPATPSRSIFFGDPGLSQSSATVDIADAGLELRVSDTLTVRNRTVFADYDKFYANVFPGAVNADRTRVSLSAYNNLTRRENLFNQTDVILKLSTGPVLHTLLFGAELGRQETVNLRLTGFFGNTATSIQAPFDRPTLSGTPITFRPGATDADNAVTATVAAVYVQDQAAITPELQLVAGLRFDNFELEVDNNRNGTRLSRTDELVSPRLGLIYEPLPELSLYASYSVSYLPSSGDQFASLTPTSATLEPEEFRNHEVGAKWELRPDLLLTAALYELERSNTTARDPLDPSRTVQTGETRSRGFELEIAGRVNARWEVRGGYALQEVEITSATLEAPAGRRVPLTPEHTFSLWNKVDVTDRTGVGLGVIRSAESFTGIDNTVVLPAFTRVDAALFHQLTPRVRAQLNVENLLDEDYFPTAHSNNNITPGSPRAVRVSLSANF